MGPLLPQTDGNRRSKLVRAPVSVRLPAKLWGKILKKAWVLWQENAGCWRMSDRGPHLCEGFLSKEELSRHGRRRVSKAGQCSQRRWEKWVSIARSERQSLAKRLRILTFIQIWWEKAMKKFRQGRDMISLVFS